MTQIDDIIYSPITPQLDWSHLWRDLDKRNARIVRTVLDNLKWKAETYPHPQIYYDKKLLNFLAEANAMILPRLLANHIVGVQPIITADDAALVVRMEYNKDNENLNLVNKVVYTRFERLSARWVIDPPHDYMEQLKMVVDETIVEQDQELLRYLRHSVAGASDPIPEAFIFDAGKLSKPEDYRMLPVLMGRQSSLICRDSMRGKATWAVVSPLVLNYLDMSNTSAFLRDQNNTFFHPPVMPSSVKYIGILNQILIFCDPYADDSTPVLLGYHNTDTSVDSSIIWSPYICIDDGGVITDPNTFELIRGFRTTYARTGYFPENPNGIWSASKNYLGLVGITGLPSIL